ncbi:hypothetical protein GCM10011408_02290 [Dyella caseinilytica]|nr:hypothetical protein GCM10011408_02290 [Dyella caseinilytica]
MPGESETARWDFINALDEEYLTGGVILSEWCVFIVRSADEAFVSGAFLASILTAVAGIETYLRSESSQMSRQTLAKLIDESELRQKHISELHILRQYRNRWAHVNDTGHDTSLIADPGKHEKELETMAAFSARLLRKTIYANRCV